MTISPRVLGVLWLGLVLLPADQSACWGKVEGSLEVLEQIKVGHLANQEKLATWEGQVTIEEYVKDAAGLLERTARVEFACDRERRAWLFHWTYVKTRGGEMDGVQYGGMALENAWHSYGPYVPGPNTGQGVVVRAREPIKVGPMTPVFDPMYYFKLRSGDLERRVQHWLNNADADWLNLVIERDGDLVTVIPTNVTIPTASARYVFDVSKGGNLVSVVARDDLAEERWNTEYEQRSGVWVPQSASYQNEKHDGTGLSRKTVTWQRSVVNQPLAEDTFTLDAMGTVPGALITDQRLGKVRRYKMPDLQQAREEKQRGPLFSENRRGRTLLVIGSGVLLLILVVTLFLRQRKTTLR